MATQSTETTFQQTRYTDAEWTSAYSALVLKDGEFAITTDVTYSGTNCLKFKMGDGTNPWALLDYYPVGSGGGGTWGSITGTLSSQTDLQTVLTALQLPTQTGHNGEFLTTNGTSASWTAAPGSIPPWLNVIQYQQFK